MDYDHWSLRILILFSYSYLLDDRYKFNRLKLYSAFYWKLENNRKLGIDGIPKIGYIYEVNASIIVIIPI